jgi:hypothetical protein
VEETIQTPTRQSPTKTATLVAEQYEEEAAACCCGCRRTTSMRVCPGAIDSWIRTQRLPRNRFRIARESSNMREKGKNLTEKKAPVLGCEEKTY